MPKPKKAYRTSVYDKNTGKRISLYARSQRELDIKVLELKKQIIEQKDLETNRTFSYWAERWMKEQKIPSGISKGTLVEYESAIKYLNKEFGDKDLSRIHLSDFQSFINELALKNPHTGKPSAKGTLMNICKVAHSIFVYASANAVPGIIDYFSMVSISKDAPVNKRESLDYEQINMILSTEFRMKPLVMIMLFCGLRRGEVIPLQWNDIDFVNHTISVSKSVVFEPNMPRVKKGGKSLAATRTVPMPIILEQYLWSYKEDNSVINVLVCPNRQGKMYTKTSFNCDWNQFLWQLNKKYGYSNLDVSDVKASKLPMRIKEFTSHYLRHTYATMLYWQGVDQVTAMRLLGHSNIQVTINTYTDLKKYPYELPVEFKEKLLSDFRVPVSMAS